MPGCGTNQSTPWRGVIVVAVLALAVRLMHIWGTLDVPTARHLIGDAAGYYAWSQRIAAGEWVGQKAFYQAPLYPYVLAVWDVFGFGSISAIRVMQALCGTVACALLSIAASRMFCVRVGLLSGIMLALYGPAIYFDGIIQKASLDCLLVCAMLACIAALLARWSWPRCALLGAVVSLLCLTRENAMAWHAVLLAWIVWSVGTKEAIKRRNFETPRKDPRGSLPDTSPNGPNQLPRYHVTKLRNLLAYLLGASLVLLSVGMRNLYVQGEFLLTTSQAGPNFYIGNNANADGRYQPLVRGHETPTFEQRDATELAERAAGHKLTPREVSRYWLGRAWSDILANPIGWLKLTGYKLLLVWNRYEIADAESIAIYRRHSWVLNPLSSVWHFGVLAPLAVLGIALTWNKRRRLAVLYALILTMTLAVAAFYVLARYRYPLVPLLIPFAAAGCVEFWRRRAQWREFKGVLSLAAFIAIICNLPIQDEKRLDALAEMNAGVALAQAGEIEEAASFFARAVAGHPASAEANYNLALTLALQGKFSDAIPYYDRAILSQPDLIGVHFNLAVAYERAGNSTKALRHFELALQQDPGDSEAQAAIDRLRR